MARRKDGTEYVMDWHITPVRAPAAIGPDGHAAGGPTTGPVTH